MLHFNFQIYILWISTVSTAVILPPSIESHPSHQSASAPPKHNTGYISGYGEANSMGPPWLAPLKPSSRQLFTRATETQLISSSDDEYTANLNLPIPSTDDPGGPLCLNISSLISGGGINGGITNYAVIWPRPAPVCVEYWLKADCARSVRHRGSQQPLSSGDDDGSSNPRLIWPRVTNTPVAGATCINSTVDAGAGVMVAPQGMLFSWNERDCSRASSVYDGQYY